MINQNDTLFAGREISVTLDGGTTETFTVRQFRLREYQKLLPIVADEIALVAAACGKTKADIELVRPDSYELLHAAMREVNAAGFFTYTARQEAAGKREIQSMLDAGIPAERIMQLLTAGRSISSTPSRPLPPGAA